MRCLINILFRSLRGDEEKLDLEEVKELNNKVFLVAVALLALAILGTPVIAEPTMGQKVPAQMITIGGGPNIPGEYRMTNGGILQVRGEQQVIYNTLYIGSEDYNVYSSNVWDGVFNFKIGMIIHNYNTVWYIPGEGSDSGFSGNVEAKIYGLDLVSGTYSRMTVHSVTQGFGDFEGQTLMLSYDGPPGGAWTGYCLKG
jgi:hypothetical protein